MNRFNLVACVLLAAHCLLLLPDFTTMQAMAQPREQPAGILSLLKAGQSVGLKNDYGHWTLTVATGIPQSYRVEKLGRDHLVVVDITGVRRFHIPHTAISAVIELKVP